MRLNKKPLSAFASLRDEQILENIAFPYYKDLKYRLLAKNQQAFLKCGAFLVF
ncbi:hypothetical protein VN1242_14540 [Helicobacter pylori]